MTVELFTWGFVQWVEQAVTFQPAARDKGTSSPRGVRVGISYREPPCALGQLQSARDSQSWEMSPTQGKGDADGEGARAEGETSPPRLNEQPQKPQNTHQPQV